MITRTAEEEVKFLASQFKAIAIVGPRQSGKTTLARTVFPNKQYVSLENLDNRLFATEDTRGFLAQYSAGAIFDEAQRVPELFSYLQQVLDEDTEKGKFVLTGSNNFLLQENISQSLAGRIGYLYLLPFSTEEIGRITHKQQSVEEAIYNGGYPPIYDNQISPNRWLSNYIRTYVERDVRQIKNVNNLGAFERFVKLCAGRIGQLLNVSSLANETGVDAKTISSWISVLESSFIIYLLKPHHQNFNKRLVKMPKLYFYDTGLACSLLGIQNAEQLKTHSALGNLFENYVITDMIKTRYNRNEPMNLYFWRDNSGNEMDVIIDNGGTLHPVEIKSGKTITAEFFKNFKFWQKISGTEGGAVIYGGEQVQNRSNGLKIVPWNSLEARI
ncbi:ATP-binding protein [Pedobacter sp. BMA]|uniref:ATP-binding protein n=1 Tax=Pedobacter sp. BMA TaxID=1663685 RepID=UPI000649B8C9|nr:ATP-binding protein [Pedobacter sp. BMA]KLT67190.1 ATPase AAA [Pedobacter sp. BMA]